MKQFKRTTFAAAAAVSCDNGGGDGAGAGGNSGLVHVPGALEGDVVEWTGISGNESSNAMVLAQAGGYAKKPGSGFFRHEVLRTDAVQVGSADGKINTTSATSGNVYTVFEITNDGYTTKYTLALGSTHLTAEEGKIYVVGADIGKPIAADNSEVDTGGTGLTNDAVYELIKVTGTAPNLVLEPATYTSATTDVKVTAPSGTDKYIIGEMIGQPVTASSGIVVGSPTIVWFEF